MTTNIDMTQFYETFLEEASEHLHDLENALLELEDNIEAELDLDSVFRAAHSIKGGAGTFGFEAIASFTHVMESMLQKARDGELKLSQNVVSDLLRAVDVVAELIVAARANETLEKSTYQDIHDKMESYVNNGEPQGEESTLPEDDITESRIIQINFKPHQNMAFSGSDPVNIFTELKTLGLLTSTINIENLPEFTSKNNPHDLFLSWKVELETDATESDVRDAFMFVEDMADIDIKIIAAVLRDAPTAEAEVTQSGPSTPAIENAVEKAVEASVMNERRKNDRREENRRAQNAQTTKESAVIRVSVDKIDSLINLVGELVTSNAMVNAKSKILDADMHEALHRSIDEMSAHTRMLQEGIMAVRMLPVEFVFSRFPRMVRDTAKKLNKKVQLLTEGGQTELDKTVIEQIADPLTHLIRNAVDHGIETPDVRAQMGKPEEGSVTLSASYKGGNVHVEIKDDGKGLDPTVIYQKALAKGLANENEEYTEDEIFQFIFSNGFSTADAISDVSGRGVGMDVVLRNIKSLGGSVTIKSSLGEGTTFDISLPLTLAIVDGMSVTCGGERYIIPLLNIVESVRPSADIIQTVKNNVDLIDIRGEYLPLLRLEDALVTVPNKDQKRIPPEEGIAVVIEAENKKIAIFVDDLLGECQAVIKSLEDNYKHVEGISGASIMGDGKIAFILDLPSIIEMSTRKGCYKRQEDMDKISLMASQNTRASNTEEPTFQEAQISALNAVKEAVRMMAKKENEQTTPELTSQELNTNKTAQENSFETEKRSEDFEKMQAILKSDDIDPEDSYAAAQMMQFVKDAFSYKSSDELEKQ